MEIQYYTFKDTFSLENGEAIQELRLAYHTWGKLNKRGDNVVWVCHALTANSNVPEWWPSIAGPDGFFNPDKYFIICVNIIGSCYGSTSPLDLNPINGQPYFHNFPMVTIRDWIHAFNTLRKELGIQSIFACIGGSCGGHQAMEFAIIEPDLIQHLFLVVTSARETAWSIAIHTSQRMAIESDGTWKNKNPDAGLEGMKAARGMGLLTYRSYDAYIQTQTDPNEAKIKDLKASSYIRYQGEKLAERFNAHSYWHLTNSLDSHHVGRDRKSIANALSKIKSKTLVIGFDTDMLIPPIEQKLLAEYIPEAKLQIIASLYGHDSFLIMQGEIANLIRHFLHGVN